MGRHEILPLIREIPLIWRLKMSVLKIFFNLKKSFRAFVIRVTVRTYKLLEMKQRTFAF